MKIKYSSLFALRDILVGLALSTLFGWIFVAVFISDIGLLGKVGLGIVFGAILLAAIWTLVKGLVRLTIGRLALSADEKALTYYHGLFKQKRLVVPYSDIASLNQQATSFKEGAGQFLGQGKVGQVEGLLKASFANQHSRVRVEELADLPLSQLVIQFKQEGHALQYARTLGIRLGSRLDYIERYNCLSLPLVDVSAFSIEELTDYVLERSNKV